MNQPKLENWSIRFYRFGARLTGYVYGHPQRGEGSSFTSNCDRVQINPRARTFTSTDGTIYQLGRSRNGVR